MMYKDKEKALEAARERMRRYRARKAGHEGVTSEQGVTSKGVTNQGVTVPDVTPKPKGVTLPGNYGQVHPAIAQAAKQLQAIKAQSYNPMMVGYVPPK